MPRLAPQNQRLTGKQKLDFRNALIDAYGTPAVLDQMLQFNLGKKLPELSLANDMPTIAFDVINKAEDQAWSRDLLAAALTSNPANPELLAFSQQFEPGSTGPDPIRPDQGHGIAPQISPEDVQSLKLQLASRRESLRLIEQRKAEYVEDTDIPLTLLKNESKLRAQIAELEAKLWAAGAA